VHVDACPVRDKGVRISKAYGGVDVLMYRLGESQMRQQNMAVSSKGLRPKSDCSGKAQKQLYK
jgi:hypothetical protein